MMQYISNTFSCLVHFVCFTNTRTVAKFFFVQRAGFFSSVSTVLRNIGTVCAVSRRINTDSYGKKSCGGKLFSWFPKSAPEKDKPSKKSCGEKKGGRHLFSRAFGGYRREHINYSDWLNLDRMVSGRMAL